MKLSDLPPLVYFVEEVSKTLATEKELVSITVDPKLETADVDVSNNSWPREVKASEFDKFKDQNKN